MPSEPFVDDRQYLSQYPSQYPSQGGSEDWGHDLSPARRRAPWRVALIAAVLGGAAAVVQAQTKAPAPAPAPAPAQDAPKPVYRCPGPPVLYTDAISAQEARDKNCRTIEGAPLTIVQGTRRAPPAASPASPSANTGPRAADTKVDPAAQRARDSDARRILEAELRREEDKLDQLRREFNNGEPERRGDERNFAKYQERVAEMRAGVQRKESDVAAIKRELAKLPP